MSSNFRALPFTVKTQNLPVVANIKFEGVFDVPMAQGVHPSSF